jgi:hypothetical protein
LCNLDIVLNGGGRGGGPGPFVAYRQTLSIFRNFSQKILNKHIKKYKKHFFFTVNSYFLNHHRLAHTEHLMIFKNINGR